ncbi:PRC-barrel domain-containing protein [Hydrogenophaga sp.]|uniref:PRC-barrel domain-containing protein n=1 Tax=Hydrogenophaga sp. TaxID=1904254 RepID=UPI0027276B8E|nr:PRC-barrel domain-containing protein [Hydrogenophaga sp.]MDO8906786.1 PRC-barrel domain-containing protein [Hydrogenophaga sp.]
MNYEERDSFGIYATNPTIAAVDDTVPERNRGPGPYLMGADTLLGNDVVNTSNENLGDIKEIMLDMRTGHVSYAVLSFGGFLGMGEKLFAVPWDALKLDTVNKNFVLDASKDRLENAPGFDKNDWPDMADTTWEKGVHEFYGTQPYVGQRGN